MKISSEIGTMSLVGIGRDVPFPLSFGNYFRFTMDHGTKIERIEFGPRCCNMWAENLIHLKREGIIDDTIDVDLYSIGDYNWAVVTDERIPKEYLNRVPCFTGYRKPPHAIFNFMIDKYGWNIDKNA